MKREFINANEAFEYYLDYIRSNGQLSLNETKRLKNVSFTIKSPMDNKITVPERKWSEEYAEAEWQWYLSGDRKTSKLGEIYGKIPKIWTQMENSAGEVNSNYGWQWKRSDQIDYVVGELRRDKSSRRAAISIYDGKEWPQYRKDTPCTFAIHFSIELDKLDMTVMMRSNDLWFGFCNDQYCFSKLQQLIAERLNLQIGDYHHFVCDLHIYKKHF